MTISKDIASFKSAVDATRIKLAKVADEIAELEAERGRVTREKLHSEDIVNIFIRGLRSTEQDFERQLRANLTAVYRADSFTTSTPAQISNVMRLPAQEGDRDRGILHGRDGLVALNVTALTYLLRDRIAAEIPALVEKLCPGADKGMKQADRERALKDIDLKLVKLRSDREALEADLNAARAAAFR